MEVVDQSELGLLCDHCLDSVATVAHQVHLMEHTHAHQHVHVCLNTPSQISYLVWSVSNAQGACSHPEVRKRKVL